MLRLRLAHPAASLAVLLPASLALGMLACKAPWSSSDAGPAPSASAKRLADDGYRPAHPGHVKQRDAKGGFMIPRSAPAPRHSPVFATTVFDGVPADVKLDPLKSENGHCGELDLGGGQKVVLDCLTDDYGMVPGAARSVLNGDDLALLRRHGKLPPTVDHRKDGTEGEILDQGGSLTCTSFSLAAAADHAAAHFLGQPPNLSPMHAWARYHAPKMGLADMDNVGKGLADLDTFPFDSKLANAWQKGQARVDPNVLRRADSKALIDITNITRLENGNLTEIKSALAAGQDVWFALKAAHGIQHTKKNKDGESVVPNFDWRTMPSTQRGGHAIVLAGYQDGPQGTYYLIHNSWGKKWGTGGYAWMWEKTLKTNIADAYVLQVRPTDLARSGAVPAIHKYMTCEAGLAPDAVTTECVPPCSDNGPRVNGVCPTAGQCPDGEVNLDGNCEISGPSIDKTLSNGVKVTCGLSGCTYVVPNGQASCTSVTCAISCAAPRFMLGSGANGLTCDG